MREKILVPRLDVIMNAIDVNAIDGNLRSLEFNISRYAKYLTNKRVKFEYLIS